MDNNIQGRIREVISTVFDGNDTRFCERIGKKPDRVKDIGKGRGADPNYELIYSILSSDIGISSDWLILGEGPMMRGTTHLEDKAPKIDIHNNQTVNVGNWGELVELVKSLKQ